MLTVINQDYIKIEEYFTKYVNIDILKNKNKLLVIADYENKSKYNSSNIKFKYRYKEPIYTVPHNYIFSDACNDGNVLDFLYKISFIFKPAKFATQIFHAYINNI